MPAAHAKAFSRMTSKSMPCAIVDAQAKAGDLTAARSTLSEVRRLAEKYQAEMRASKDGDLNSSVFQSRLYQCSIKRAHAIHSAIRAVRW